MESIGVFADGEWDSLSKYFGIEEVDFTSQFLSQSSFSLDHQNEGLMMNFLATSAANATNPDEGLFVNSNISQYFNMPQGNYALSHDDRHNVTNDYLSMSMDISIMDQSKLDMDIDINSTTNNQLPSVNPNNELKLKRKFDMPEFNTTDAPVEHKVNFEVMKKLRVQRNTSRTNKKNTNVQTKKNGSEGEEMSNAGSDRQSTSSHSSEDDFPLPETSTTSDSKTVGKTRANRGEAKDPQSLYARKRRERINERLRILQNIVPNGTKVDISTMLEDAVHYVKFLQLQIKLLSSDDLWMYAPICYNGVDVGLNHKLSALL